MKCFTRRAASLDTSTANISGLSLSASGREIEKTRSVNPDPAARFLPLVLEAEGYEGWQMEVTPALHG
ncbi:MAG TPA: hypothetical protein PLV96_09830 [Methanoregulaceae archaeon]|nr:hypothetical protein [Methanoregulaceae archaeon]HQA81081.1 hypothetical protein [Methanoregulaceae archaeon]